MRKTLYTLDIGNYAPAIKARTFPFFERWAAKIGARFHPITTRAFPAWPVVYEKLQIFQLGREHDNDWNIFLDADALIHPDMPDLAEHLPFDTVFHFGNDPCSVRFARDDYFRRDGRNIGSCNWFTIGSRLCLDLWHPLEDLTLEEAIKRIHPTVPEQTGDSGKPGSVIEASHLIDDYTLSRNIARFGLKVQNARTLFESMGMPPQCAWHVYNKTNEDKVAMMDEVLHDKWKLKHHLALAQAS